jgi:DnaJ like chaperone protein
MDISEDFFRFVTYLGLFVAPVFALNRPFHEGKALEPRVRALLGSRLMNEGAIARWLEQKRRRDRAWAAVISALALGSGVAVFLLTALLIYVILVTFCGAFVRPVFWLGLVSFGLTAGIFARSMKGRQDGWDLWLDPMGLWILKDIGSVGPRLMLEGLRHLRRCGQLGELNIAACALALAYLAAQDAAVTWQDLMLHCPNLAGSRLKEQLALLDGVLFLGEDGARVTLMDPFRLRLRWMLGREQKSGKRQEPARPRPEPAPQAVPVNEPEKLSAYEILGLSPSASVLQIKTAYRKRVKECHPDLFAGMDQQARDLADRWTKALNAAYATLSPRQRGARPNSPGKP